MTLPFPGELSPKVVPAVRTGDCSLILQPSGTDKHGLPDLLGATSGNPVALNGNSFLKYIFAFQSLKLCEDLIMAHLNGALFWYIYFFS